MNRIDARFAKLSARGRKALVPFITAGDPSLDATVPVMHALAAAGADVIELGVPFSDPMADGPTIQRSSERALAAGASLDWVFEAVRRFRETDQATPVVLMGYLNPVEIRGADRYARQAVAAGIDGTLLVDLPPEEAQEFRDGFAPHGLALVLLAAPTTSPDRIASLCAQASGYLYYVSYSGVTGADHLDTGSANDRLKLVREHSRVPVVAGFGIKDAASAVAMARGADGVVVGSALVSAIAGSADPDQAASRARAFLEPLRSGLDGLPAA